MSLQTEFTETHKLEAVCCHCGKPMNLSIDRWHRKDQFSGIEKRDVYKVWIDPEHECTYLSIDAKDKAISA